MVLVDEEMIYIIIVDIFLNVFVIWVKEVLEVVSDFLVDFFFVVCVMSVVMLVVGILVLVGVFVLGYC